MTSKNLPGSADWLAERGISPDVWRARGVWRYTPEDAEKVIEAVAPFVQARTGISPRTGRPINEKQSVAGRIGVIRDWVTQTREDGTPQTGGLVMPRRPLPGRPDIPPQLRPDDTILTSREPPEFHYHGPWPFGPGARWPREPRGPSLQFPEQIMHPESVAATKHIYAGFNDDDALPYDPKTGKGEHKGVNYEKPHRHVRKQAKYVFLPGSVEDRIDVHPFAAERLADAERVFHVLEGVPKTDAVLSADVVAVGSPSVTLWDEDEIALVVDLLAPETVVFVVPDADWEENPLVDMQALFIRSAWRRAGDAKDVYALIAAPPVEFFKDMEREGRKGMKGVDDWLGIHGQAWARRVGHPAGIDGLVIRGKERGQGVHRLFDRGPVRHARDIWAPLTDYDLGLRRAIAGLSLHADGEGRHTRGMASLARVMEMHRAKRPERIVPRLAELERRGAIKIHGTLDWERHEHKVRGRRRSNVVKDWANPGKPPTIEVQEDFRAVEKPRALVGDFSAAEA
jgi:hypothetical protein